MTAAHRPPATVTPLAARRARFLTVAEVADVLRVGRSTVYRLVQGGELPAVQIRRSLRIPTEALAEYIDSNGAGR